MRFFSKRNLIVLLVFLVSFQSVASALSLGLSRENPTKIESEIEDEVGEEASRAIYKHGLYEGKRQSLESSLLWSRIFNVVLISALVIEASNNGN